MTKVWGWAEPAGPLQFSKSGWRDRVREQLEPGDLVVMVATTGENTDELMRGKIVGLMQPTPRPVSSFDYGMEPLPEHFGSDGLYKWPYGLENAAAWSFDEPWTSLSEITDRRFHMDSALGIVPLADAESEAILKLPKRSVELLLPLRSRARLFGTEAARRHGAPVPTTTRRGVMHFRRSMASTYAMRIVGADTDAYKIGWAFDPIQRCRQFNHAAMPLLGGLAYELAWDQVWNTARQAFQMEQLVLRQFRSKTHPANREVILVSKDELLLSWARAAHDVQKRST
jgi:hypothetical protein